MRPENVPDEWVQKAAEATYLTHPDTESFDGSGGYTVVPYKALSKYRRRIREADARHALAAVLSDDMVRPELRPWRPNLGFWLRHPLVSWGWHRQAKGGTG